MIRRMQDVPLCGFAAFSGTGKTTLLRALLPRLRERGLRIAVVKHAHHDFDTDIPGKDSYELRKAGAAQMLVASRRRWALITEMDGKQEPALDDLLTRLDVDAVDLILVEGFKTAPIPKIELHRPALGRPLLCLTDPSIIAVATDSELQQAIDVPQLPLNQPEEIAAFLLDYLELAPTISAPPKHVTQTAS